MPSSSTENNADKYNIVIDVSVQYIEAQSVPDDERYVFSYTINILNKGTESAQLISRHWIITDAEGESQEVKGPGVVGEHPYLKPGEDFTYTSGTIIKTPVGSMHGSYQMKAGDGQMFDVEIRPFTLAKPSFLH
ncbi:MAG: Co2+/Mg2+ efflux protein ApaG [gamma proteobacterium symbiont of Bathyaustriella thionipta]|nr:Co2+/Mg2+ efflux protein ApaG [gamma proteobacterium symbiont of Bathyaustriella thionipta]MCU7950549.1 Co2+/Mg2+ efflux protein ApaG [gamma proteobacterium symbiont of Bathyaustriella thionipta]MCU7953024.1 Co2+/Mg2+ efflux protein ApaG [gamma proteobacterium symbiont of Bathyaustriella thionipta]MCU7957057.1 Co2+/Mg2+ efflux protein ApaG [gamma proteobacterium symbiont of Bathyaustriella thionipta]MCU7966727.1 Co2+/Mg2+ efflux protein ApaG [gamma proteobacterium symbiont of Bathyaustriella